MLKNLMSKTSSLRLKTLALAFSSLIAMAPLISPASLAQNIGRSGLPVYVSSDHFEGTEKQGHWRGNVRIVQGKSILVADEIIGALDTGGGIEKITAIGHVRYSDGEQAISGNRGIYDEKARTLTMTENVIVTQGRNVFTAGNAIYWVDTGRVMFSPAEGERVRGVFYTDQVATIN